MGTKKLTDLERLQLLTMYAAGFREEAWQYAMELGVSKHYATVLYARFLRPYQRRKYLVSKWEKALKIGKVEAGREA